MKGPDMRTLIAATLAAAAAFPTAASTATVRSLCQVEVPADEAVFPARRGETVGFMKRADGQVKVLRPKPGGFDELDAEVGMDLFAADAVATGANGAFDVIFTDNTTLTGVADTCVEISTYVYRAAEKTGEFRMRLGRGVVSVAAGDVAKSGADRMSVRIRNDTNLAVTGTRIVIRAK